MSASLDANVSLDCKTMDQNVNHFYEEFVDGTGHWFLCKYQECGELEATELQIVKHLRQHFTANGGEPSQSPNYHSVDTYLIFRGNPRKSD